jgi:hypothetical protein
MSSTDIAKSNARSVEHALCVLGFLWGNVMNTWQYDMPPP